MPVQLSASNARNLLDAARSGNPEGLCLYVAFLLPKEKERKPVPLAAVCDSGDQTERDALIAAMAEHIRPLLDDDEDLAVGFWLVEDLEAEQFVTTGACGGGPPC